MSDKKKISVIGTVGIPAKYGGFETLVHQMVRNLHAELSFTVYCSTKAYKDRPRNFESARLKYIPLNANGAQSILYDYIAILISLFSKADALLILGVSGATILPLVKLLSRKKVILHIDGLEWKRAKWSPNARRFLKFSEKIGCRYSNVLIADNREIKSYIAQEYGLDSVLIEYGADHIIKHADDSNHDDYAFSVCRIEPENNIHLILEAFSRSTVPLKLVGNWEHSEYGRGLLKKYAACPNITMFPPIYDQHKLDQLRANCRVYIHGHSAGGTNPSLVEAMFLKLPVIAFDVSYNRATTEDQALYFKEIDELTGILNELPGIDLAGIAGKMKQIAGERYTWSVIAEKYRRVFLT